MMQDQLWTKAFRRFPGSSWSWGFLSLAWRFVPGWRSRWGFSSISIYLLAGLGFGNGGLAPLNLSKSFIQLGAEVGVLLLLFMLGLEYSGEQLKESLSRGWPAGVVDFMLNFPPGLAAGMLLGWNFMAPFCSAA